MGLKIVCHACSYVLFEGFELIPFFKLRDQLDGKCPNCNRKLAIRPISVELYDTKPPKNNSKIPTALNSN
jgi:hypothetical protein